VSAPYVPLPRLAELGDILTESAREAGRDPDRIVRLYNVMGLIMPESRDMFHGPKERWVDTFTTLYSDFGMNTFVFWPAATGNASPASSPRKSSPPCAKRWSATSRLWVSAARAKIT
jgi:hypothetical protein